MHTHIMAFREISFFFKTLSLLFVSLLMWVRSDDIDLLDFIFVHFYIFYVPRNIFIIYNLHPSQKSVLLLDYAVVCKSGKVFFGAVCNLVIPPPLKSGPLEVNKPSIDQLLLWPHRRNEDFQSQPNI